MTLLLIPTLTRAGAGIAAVIGNEYYEGLEEAIEAASSSDVIKLVADIELDNSLNINKTVNINLNGHTVSTAESVFLVEGGSLNLTGKGTVKETKPNYGAIVIKGSESASDENYSTVSVGANVMLEGWSGVFVKQSNDKAYGVNINMNGSINAIKDINDNVGAGIYVNGKIKHQNNHPIINLSTTTKITSTGDGIYIAGYATVNINGATITGNDSGVAMKSGILNMNSGTITCIGTDRTPTSGNTNGINPSGTAIQIESNNSYAGDIIINIKGGLIKSNNSYAMYEYTTNSSSTKVSDILISGGKFVAGSSKSVFHFSESFKSKHTAFISGGEFSTTPNSYLKSGYKSEEISGLYEVMPVYKEINYAKIDDDKNNSSILIIAIPLLVVAVLMAYFFRNNIKILFNNLMKK